MDREEVREQVRAVLMERLAAKGAAPAAQPSGRASHDLVSWRRFDDPRDAVRRPLAPGREVRELVAQHIADLRSRVWWQ